MWEYVVWMLGFPLVAAAVDYIAYKRGASRTELPSLVSGFVMIMWIGIGIVIILGAK